MQIRNMLLALTLFLALALPMWIQLKPIWQKQSQPEN